MKDLIGLLSRFDVKKIKGDFKERKRCKRSIIGTECLHKEPNNNNCDAKNMVKIGIHRADYILIIIIHIKLLKIIRTYRDDISSDNLQHRRRKNDTKQNAEIQKLNLTYRHWQMGM